MDGSMVKQKLKVGGYMKYYCSRCKLELGHTVVAMINNQPARVKCDTCKTEHNYRVKKNIDQILRHEPQKIRPKTYHPELYQQKLKEASSKAPKPYRIDE